ncbi:MAG: hypothetical protein FD167_1161 [bacterium]|nr:MAG: hypothetical protein FD167_1161 [bacterium]
MDQTLPLSVPTLLTSYTLAFRRDARQLVAWGYEDARSIINSQREETEITGFIAEAIENRLDDPQTPKRFDHYAISEDKPISGHNLTGKSRRRLDIVIGSNESRPRAKYVFEAKRLLTGSHPIGKYTDLQGLQRFTSGKYASQYPEAAMIGYMQNKNADYWYKELFDNFAKDKSKSLSIIATLEKISVLPEFQNEWLSKHKRNDNSIIDIYHIFLDCT